MIFLGTDNNGNRIQFNINNIDINTPMDGSRNIHRDNIELAFHENSQNENVLDIGEVPDDVRIENERKMVREQKCRVRSYFYFIFVILVFFLIGILTIILPTDKELAEQLPWSYSVWYGISYTVNGFVLDSEFIEYSTEIYPRCYDTKLVTTVLALSAPIGVLTSTFFSYLKYRNIGKKQFKYESFDKYYNISAYFFLLLSMISAFAALGMFVDQCLSQIKEENVYGGSDNLGAGLILFLIGCAFTTLILWYAMLCGN